MILRYPDKTLNTVCAEVRDVASAHELLSCFKRSVTDNEKSALGLAAPQVGLCYNLIWIRDFGYMFNPRVISHSDEIVSSYESCLSVDESFWVERYKTVTILYKDESFKMRRKTFSTYVTSTVAQHEIDHLNGILICDK